MKKQYFFFRTVGSLLLAALVLAACSAPAAESAPPAALNVETAIFSAINELENRYGFGMLESIDLSGNDSFLAAENGFIW